MIRVIIKAVAKDGSDWEDRWDQTFESAADARAFIEMIQEHGIDDMSDTLDDLTVVFDLNEEAFLIYAEE